MFNHSVPVPRLYKTAAKITQKVIEEGASLKQLIYEKKHPNLKAIFALVATILKKSSTLNYIIRNTQILIKESRLDPWLARVLITELLWGKKRLLGDSKPIQTVLNYQNIINDSLLSCKDNEDSTSNETKEVKKPKYVRVNTLKTSVEKVIEFFRYDGWILQRYGDESDYAAYLATVASLSEEQFVIDIHIKDLLVFAPNTQFYQHPLYLDGHIILQDKASCLSPYLLDPSPDSTVLDMCSAPGMKTSQLAAMIGKNGKIYAVEKDQRRFNAFCALMEGLGVSNVEYINKDVLTLTDKELKNVEYILVDPSCSGSGIVDRIGYEDTEAKSNKFRLSGLAGFQITILRHALTNFPNAKRVIYSTCSIYSEENENVITQVIKSISDFKLVSLKEKLNNLWYHFGSDDFGEIGSRCLYAHSDKDLTNGFFVAMFERIEDGETNEFFVKRVKRTSECNNDDTAETSNSKKSKRSKKKDYEQDENNKVTVSENAQIFDEEVIEPKKKCKKSKKEKLKDQTNEEYIILHESIDEQVTRKSKKFKKEKVEHDNSININTVELLVDNDGNNYAKMHKKSKKEISKDQTDTEYNVPYENIVERVTKTNKKKKHGNVAVNPITTENDKNKVMNENNEEQIGRKKKLKKRSRSTKKQEEFDV